MERTQLFDLMGELKLYGMKAAFERYASAHNNSVPAALAELVQHVIRSAGIHVGDLTPPAAPPQRSERVTVRLSLAEMRDAETLAQGHGGVREWIVSLVRSRTTAGHPQFSPAEQIALYESNRELWAIGRNVNQIAHALNSDLYQAGQLQGSLQRLPELVTNHSGRHVQRKSHLPSHRRKRAYQKNEIKRFAEA